MFYHFIWRFVFYGKQSSDFHRNCEEFWEVNLQLLNSTIITFVSEVMFLDIQFVCVYDYCKTNELISGNIFTWVGDDQRKWLNFVKDPDHILDTNKSRFSNSQAFWP